MPIDPPSNVYRDQLSALSQGLALWNPNPLKGIYNNVSIGDVGYLHEGTFVRMFNVMLPWDDPSNSTLGKPEFYPTLDCGPFSNSLQSNFDRVEYYSRHVSPAMKSGIGGNTQASPPEPTEGVTADGGNTQTSSSEQAEVVTTNSDSTQVSSPEQCEGVTYKSRTRGALLSLPNGGRREEVIRTKAFEDYIRDHVVSWFNWAQKNKLGVERMEELILVSARTLVTSWAAATFVDNTIEAEITLANRVLSNGGASFVWSKIQGPVVYHNSRHDPQNPPTTPDQCVFIKGFRAKRVFFWTRRIRAAAEPLPDDPDSSRDDEIQVTQVPGASKYRDPLLGVLDYIAEKCIEDALAEDTIAIAHDDDFQFIEDEDTLTADATEKFLRENQIPLLVENGVAVLRDPRDTDPPVSDEKKATFYAAADLNGEPVPVIIHPVLTKYLLKLEITEFVDHDYDLPKEELTSPAVHPPMPSLKLESHQGYPQVISIEASQDCHDAVVTVQDTLRTIHEDLKMPFSRRELGKSGTEERARINTAFRERCKTEEELSNGPRRIDRLGGRDRLQILPRFSQDGGVLVPISTLCSAEPLDESRVAGPSRIPVA